jgi:hypothetical protein
MTTSSAFFLLLPGSQNPVIFANGRGTLHNSTLSYFRHSCMSVQEITFHENWFCQTQSPSPHAPSHILQLYMYVRLLIDIIPPQRQALCFEKS